MEQITLDDQDLRILYELDRDARAPFASVADKLGVSRQMLNYRMRKLIKAKVIKGFITLVDIHRLGFLTFRLYFRFRNVAREREHRIVEYFVEHPFTLWVARMQGGWDLEVVFTPRNYVHFNNLFKQAQEYLGRFYERYDISMSPVSYHFRRDYLVRARRAEFTSAFYGFEPEAKKRDEVDYRILSVIAGNARLTEHQIARKCNLSVVVVRHRIEQLEKDHVIQGYRLLVALPRLHRRYFKALVQLNNVTAAIERKIYHFCSRESFVVYLTEVLGRWQLEIECEVEDSTALLALMRSLRQNFGEHVTDYEVVEVTHEDKLSYLPSGTVEASD